MPRGKRPRTSGWSSWAGNLNEHDRYTPAVEQPNRTGICPRDGVRPAHRVPGLREGAGPLFFLVFTVAGWLRPFYDPLRHPISSVEFGLQGWIQALNFIVTGTLVILFAWAVRSPVRSLGGGRTVPDSD